MSDYSDINMLVDKMCSDLHKLRDKVAEELDRETSAAMDKAYHEFGIYQQQKIKQVFDKAVDDFYSDYTPKGYNRTYGLRDVLDMREDEHGIVVDEAAGYMDLFDETRMHKDRAGGDLFRKVFMEGWHGGAESISGEKSSIWGEHPSPGIPYYRTAGWVQYPGENRKRFHKYGKWGSRAVKSKAPYTTIMERLNVLENGEILRKFKEISQRYNDAAVEKVKQNIPKFQAEICG